MLCLRTFTEKRATDFPSWEGWVQFVNDNYAYAQEASTIEDYIDKAQPHALPSYHPYWKEKVRLQNVQRLQELQDKYAACVEDQNNIKFLFNSTTDLRMIEKMIEELTQKVTPA